MTDPPTTSPSDLDRRIADWLRSDPDSQTRGELEMLIAEGRRDELAERFSGRLRFGTAGLRAAMGAGPRRMNRLVVRQAAWGLARWVIEQVPGGAHSGVLIGFDARHNSAVFALDSARVLAAEGVLVRLVDRPAPTPVIAHAVAVGPSVAGVVVTASHNPAGDNGYKVYLGDGSQIVTPIDLLIAERIGAAPTSPVLAPLDDPLIVRLNDAPIEAYVADLARLPLAASTSGAPGRRAVVAYTPLHGVGAEVFERACRSVGFPAAAIVAAQAVPDPDFPTVDFPNPEEPGAMDAVVALAAEVGADIAIAHDPDADRLGVAIPLPGGGWRMLSGDEIGWLLADHILTHTDRGNSDRLVLTTLVSSGMLRRIAAAHSATYAETFTGFKWMAAAARDRPETRLVFAYEQALGYLVGFPPLDKDGISAALVLVSLVESLLADDRTLADDLDRLAAHHGRHRTAERSVRLDPEVIAAAVDVMRVDPPAAIVERPVFSTTWFAEAALLRLDLGAAGRVQFRPSGTEPKVKVYVEVVDGEPGAEDLLAEAGAALVRQAAVGQARNRSRTAG